MLGHKTNGVSEFCYPFRSVKESGSKPTFQEWLATNHGPRFIVHEFPTVDKLPLDENIQSAIVEHVSGLLKINSVVVLVDSAGVQRTGRVCEALGFSQSR